MAYLYSALFVGSEVCLRVWFGVLYVFVFFCCYGLLRFCSCTTDLFNFGWTFSLFFFCMSFTPGVFITLTPTQSKDVMSLFKLFNHRTIRFFSRDFIFIQLIFISSTLFDLTWNGYDVEWPFVLDWSCRGFLSLSVLFHHFLYFLLSLGVPQLKTMKIWLIS